VSNVDQACRLVARNFQSMLSEWKRSISRLHVVAIAGKGIGRIFERNGLIGELRQLCENQAVS
jgi:hypothetical protein